MRRWQIYTAAGIGGAALAYLLLMRRRRWTDEDVEYLARVTMLEAGSGGPEEWAGIMRTALNRAENADTSVRDVVANLSWPGGGARGRSFVEAVQRDRGQTEYHRAPPEHPRFFEALQFARTLARSNTNPIGQRTHFVHPQSLPRCTSPGQLNDSGSRLCVAHPSYGARFTPLWSVSRADGGDAEFDPIWLGRALFS